MFGSRINKPRRSREEGEKPFWISFSDLMSALMVLFLLVMVISLLSVTRKIREVENEEVVRNAAITRIMKKLENDAALIKDINVSSERLSIDFGEKARFASGKHHLSREAQDTIRSFIPFVLEVADTEDGKRWFKRVIVEGFTDTDGDYLLNLDLSLKRAQRVVCILLEDSPTTALSKQQKRKVQQLFLVGGFSSNSSKPSKEESRRVEIRLDFRAAKDPINSNKPNNGDFGRCQLR